MMRLLLLNPPGSRTFIRDYYCSKVSKTNYLFQPIDLVMQSGILSAMHDVTVCDAIASQMSVESVFELIDKMRPDAVISLAGSVSLDEDLAFLERIAALTQTLLVSGDAFLDSPKRWLQRCQFIKGILLDFSSDDTVRFLAGRPEEAKSIVSSYSVSPYVRPAGQEFSIPVPCHEKFSSGNYRFPFVRSRRFATILTDFGCPFRCSFCVMASLGYRYRPVDNVLAELRYLKSNGINELFFIDQSFAVKRDRALQLCQEMIGEKMQFGWVCYSRVDLIDKELLRVMKKAGCHTIIFGVESASSAILKSYQKGYTKKDILETFRLCRDEGVRTVATFILGLPEETLETAYETVEFLKNIDCDFASFNVAVPRAGTELRQNAINDGLIDGTEEIMDQAGTTIAMPTHHLTADQVRDIKSMALRRFYLRPSYLLRRLLGIRSLYELREHIYEGYSLLRNS